MVCNKHKLHKIDISAKLSFVMEIGQGLQMASMCGNNKIHFHISTHGFGVVLVSHPIQTSNVKNTYLDHCISRHSFEIQRNELNYSLFYKLEFKLEVYE
jgi:hypothetical protein